MTGLELQELLNNAAESVGIDANYFYFGKRPIDALQIPVDTVADLAYIPSRYRFEGMTVKVLSG